MHHLSGNWQLVCAQLARAQVSEKTKMRVKKEAKNYPATDGILLLTNLVNTLQGIKISHVGKRKIIFKMPFWGDMLLIYWQIYW